MSESNSSVLVYFRVSTPMTTCHSHSTYKNPPFVELH